MRRFVRLSAIAAPFPVANVDTDMILPATFLKTVSRAGLGRGLFHAPRFDGAGNPRPDCVLNTAPWASAGILIALENFGCGSSREHAPWALLDFGISCVIAPSFADIFCNNCLKNGILPLPLAPSVVAILMADAAELATAMLTVDLEAMVVIRSNGAQISIDLPDEARRRLFIGADDISSTLLHERESVAHEATARRAKPWIRPISIPLLD